jgi:hypothetical protein
VHLSIIIVSWNVKDYLKPCLDSIFGTVNNIEFEVFVVDNNSYDGTVDFIKECFPQVRLIANKDNLGFARANNQAIAKSKGRYILLLNPDTIVLPGSINRMIAFLDTNRNFGAVGPKILADDRVTVSVCAARRFPSIKTIFFTVTTLNRIAKCFSSSAMEWWDHKDSREVDSLSGSCMMVRKKVINKIGLLDESFFMYAEDIDWCYRIKKGGWKISYLCDAVIIHYGEKSAVKKFSETENMAENFKAYFKYFRKHYGLIYALFYRLMIGLIMICWNFVWIIRLFNRIKSKEEIKGIIARNNKFIRWSINIDVGN